MHARAGLVGRPSDPRRRCDDGLFDSTFSRCGEIFYGSRWMLSKRKIAAMLFTVVPRGRKSEEGTKDGKGVESTRRQLNDGIHALAVDS